MDRRTKCLSTKLLLYHTMCRSLTHWHGVIIATLWCMVNQKKIFQFSRENPEHHRLHSLFTARFERAIKCYNASKFNSEC